MEIDLAPRLRFPLIDVLWLNLLCSVVKSQALRASFVDVPAYLSLLLKARLLCPGGAVVSCSCVSPLRDVECIWRK